LKKWVNKNVEKSNNEIQAIKIEEENKKKSAEDDTDSTAVGDTTSVEGQL
jgi:hypothetical protein